MIDTLMVLWTSGMWKRLLRNTGTFLLLFLGICVLLFLITTSGSKWQGLAITVARPNAATQSGSSVQSSPFSPASAATQPAPAPTAISPTAPYIEPIILQNPIMPDRHSSRSEYKHSNHHHIPSYTPPPQTALPPSDTGSQDQANPLQNLP